MNLRTSSARARDARRERVSLPIVALLALLASPRPAQASWPFNSYVNVPVCAAGQDQNHPRCISDGNGGAFVTWVYDTRNVSLGGGTGFDVFLQHVSGSGTDPSWPVDGVPVCTLSGDQAATSIVSDGAGGAIIVWGDMLPGSTHVFAQRVSAAGVLQWAANGVTLCNLSGGLWDPIAVADGAGGAIVTWADARNGAGNYDVFAQRVNAAGAPQWTANGVAVCTQGSVQIPECITSDGAGGAIIGWTDGRNAIDYDIYAQRVNAAGSPQWIVDGLGVCVNSNDQFSPAVVSDGGGGAIIVWEDTRGSAYDIYAQRVKAAGVLMWTSGGVPICNAGGDQQHPAIVSDGAGGAVMAWSDGRSPGQPVFAQRVSAGGAPVWAANGVSPAPSSVAPQGLVMVSDGAGGAILSWAEYSNGPPDIYAQRILSSGVVPFAWPPNGRKVCTAASNQGYPTICSDGGGKAIVAWEDFRNSTNWDIYAQLVAPSGFLGVPNPVLRPFGDLLWDQGGFVKVPWDASYLDTEEPYVVSHYWVLRSAPSSLVTSALEGGRVLTPEQFGAASDALRANSGVRVGETASADGLARAGVVEPIPDALVVTVNDATDYYWEPLARIDALHAIAGYSYVAPTTCDSTALGNPLTAFMVIAYDYTGSIFLPSEPDSGYSVDNLSPATPGGLAGNATTGTTHLHWIPNEDPDLANYQVYRGNAASFIPTAANLIASPADTGFVDPGAPGSFYKLSAVDIHGNESGFALLTPSGTLDVVTEPTLVFALARPAPNPARGASNIEFALPHETHVSLAVHDVAGRAVRRIFAGVLPAGEHTQRWDLRDASGSTVRAGLYFIRLEAGGRGLTQRLIVSGE